MDNEVLRLISENKKLLNVTRCYEKIDKTSLAKVMNVSLPTITSILKPLLANNILFEDNGLKVNPNLGYYIGISIGGSQIKVCFIDFSFQVLTNDLLDEFCKKNNLFSYREDFYLQTSPKHNCNYGYFYFNTPKSFTELHDKIESIFNDIITFSKINNNILGIGLAFSGAIDNKKLIILRSHNIPYLKNINFDTLISRNQINYCKEHNINIAFEHNAKSAVVAEKFSLYSKNSKNHEYMSCRNISCVYLGSGIGMGTILNNQLYRGASNFAGELGHTRVRKLLGSQTPTNLDTCCTCGSDECIEYRIRNDVFEMKLDDFKNANTDELKECISKTGRMELLGKYIGYIINLIINMYDIDLIILTGKLTTFLDDGELWRYVNDEKRQMNLEYTNMDCSLITSNYGALAPSIGAAICSSYDNNESIEWY